jgi:DNA repair exonuclease SbcCD nuclease subunit
MSRPYAILSDLHLHEWHAFSKVSAAGVNSRLQTILDEIERAADELLKAGGNTMYLAGDIFHVRNSVTPAVLNLSLDTFQRVIARGVTVRAVPGNHDLAGKESDRLGNAAEALAKVGVHMVNDPAGHLFEDNSVYVCPWHSSPGMLMAQLKDAVKAIGPGVDCIIHAPVNGVIMGIPDHGLDPAELAALGFKRIFSGHFHNHKEFAGGVYSVGATTHQTWSDPGTKAGFLLVTPTEVQWRASHAPQFIDITERTDPSEIPLLVPGNFVRVKLEVEKESEIYDLRESLTKMGAAGVVIHPVIKSKEVVRTSGSAKIGTLAASLSSYVALKFKDSEERAKKIDVLCQEILNESEVVA